MWLQPAAMDDRTVVSEIGAQWSPKREPLRTAAMVMHCESSKPYAMWIPRGSNIAMVPQEVPVAKEMTDPMRKSIAGTMLAGMMSMVEFTINSEVPILLQTLPTPHAHMMITRMPAMFLIP